MKEKLIFMVALLLTAIYVFALVVLLRRSSREHSIFDRERLAKKQNEPQQKVFTIHGDIRFTMVRIDGGTYNMGYEKHRGTHFAHQISPSHKVKLSTFRIGQTEVTQELWSSVMLNNPSKERGAQLPVTGVSWDECQDFIDRLNMLTGEQFRLPTEAEWEYAARGGAQSRGYRYAGSDSAGMVAWHNHNSLQKPHPVARLLPNELGLYDMSGNVFEWCHDWYAMDYYSEGDSLNPQGPESGIMKVMRGGCYSSDAEFCNTRERFSRYPSLNQANVGFRLAL